MADDEVGDVAALLVAANEEHLRRFPPSVAAAYRAEVVDVAGRRPYSEVIVAEAGGRLVGAVTLLPDATADGHPWPAGGAVLRLLVVDPAARGRGVGEALTTACVERARAAGAGVVGRHTAPGMEAARRLYERLGFRRAPEHDFHPAVHYGGATAEGGEPAWGLAYVLDLGPPGAGDGVEVRIELPAEPASAGLARRAVEQACAGGPADLDAVVLCTSELVTNAVLHGRPPIALEVQTSPSSVRVAVHDGGFQDARPRRPVDPEAMSGRGLAIVEILATRWGCEPTDEGKVTWFEMGADSRHHDLRPR